MRKCGARKLPGQMNFSSLKHLQDNTILKLLVQWLTESSVATTDVADDDSEDQTGESNRLTTRVRASHVLAPT